MFEIEVVEGLIWGRRGPFTRCWLPWVITSGGYFAGTARSLATEPRALSVLCSEILLVGEAIEVAEGAVKL